MVAGAGKGNFQLPDTAAVSPFSKGDTAFHIHCFSYFCYNEREEWRKKNPQVISQVKTEKKNKKQNKGTKQSNKQNKKENKINKQKTK